MRVFLQRPRVWLGLLLGLHLALGLVYVWATPIFEAPDEGYHVAVVRHLAQGHGLPVQQPGVPADWEQEGSQPPLYYALAASLTFWVNTDDWADVYVRNPFLKHIPGTPQNVNLFRHLRAPQWDGTVLLVLLTRLFSLTLSLGTIWLTYELALALAPGQMPLALLAAAIVALNPKALFINASVNNDNLLMLLSTAALLLIVQLMQARAPRPGWWALGLGLVLGAAALTKISGLLLWPTAAAALAWAAWRARPLKQWWRTALLIGGGAVLVSGWWFWRNWHLYGEWLGLDMMVAIAHPRDPAIGLGELIQTEWRGFFLSFWSVFGVFTILPAEWVHTFFDVFTLLALVGAGWRLTRTQEPLSAATVLLLGFCLLTLAGVIRWTLQTPASQGRLLFGAIAPLAVGLAWGLLAFARAVQANWWALGLSVVLGGVAALTPILYIAPRYLPPPALTAAQLPPDLHPLHVRFDEKIELIGFTASGTPRMPGEWQTLTLYWRALQPMSRDYVLALHLLGRNYANVTTLDTWPGGGLAPTSQWQPDEIFADTYQLLIPPSAAQPSLLRLTVAIWETNPSNLLWAIDGDGNFGPNITFPIGRVIPAGTPTLSPVLAEGSVFEYDLRLLGLDARLRDDQLALNFYWQAAQPIPADYTLFLYVLDANGEPVLQADGPPLADDWPTSAWWPGLAFVDDRRITLPRDLPPGRYGLRLGWYDPSSGARLLAFRADGTPWPEEAVIVPEVFELR